MSITGQAARIGPDTAKPKTFLGLPPSPPDSYSGPWERAEHWVVWLTLAWCALCAAGTALSAWSSSEFIATVFAPPPFEQIWFRLSRQLPVTFLIYIAFGLLVERGGVNVAYTRKTFHILGTFVFPLFLTPDVIEGTDLYREWYLSVTWNSLIGFVLPYAIMIRPIRSRVRFLYLGHRCFDRPEDRPYTLIWFISQMLAVSVIMLPMTQYFVSQGMWSLYLIAAMANGLGDGLAEPVGKIWGHRTYKVRALFTGREYTRSYAGSACVAFFTALGVILNYQVLAAGEFIVLLLVLPPLMAVIEAKSPHTWDNLLLYGACWLVIYLVVFA